jgi:quercetin dioxygenase-like cupin family protein
VWAVLLGPGAGAANATEPVAITSTQISHGDLEDGTQVFFVGPHGETGGGSIATLTLFWIVVEPGGTTGWHQHSGPGWAIVVSGTLSHYEGDDPFCQATVFGPGSAFVEQELHTHTAMNHGDVPVELYAAFMLPEGGELRIDAPAPGNCPF